MSRIGKSGITLPVGVAVKVNAGIVEVKGPKGNLELNMFDRVSVKQDGQVLNIGLSEGVQSNFWGLYRTLVANMVHGVSVGYLKTLELVGTGYRAQMSGKSLNLTVGFSHPVLVDPLPGISYDVDKTGKVVITSASKELVGQMAAKIRAIRPPEPYHGKGIRYFGEVITVKAGKSSSKK